MTLIASDRALLGAARMLETYDCPAVLVSADYRIQATNRRYTEQFGAIDPRARQHCFEVSHGYQVPCDQAGETCPLAAALASGHKERVLHIHNTPRGREHVDVEMLPILDDSGQLMFFVELLRTAELVEAGKKVEDLDSLAGLPRTDRQGGLLRSRGTALHATSPRGAEARGWCHRGCVP